MFKKVKFLLVALFAMLAISGNAQVTTATLAGTVTDGSEAIIGATIQATHVPSGTHYGTITNMDGAFTINGMRAGGPYTIEVSYIGYQGQVFNDVTLSLGEQSVLDVTMKEASEMLQEVLVVASANSNMKSGRSGAITSINADQMAAVPTVSRSLTDIMKLTPQSSTSSGFAVGGGNYRQSNVTIDGAAFNNSFGLGSSALPGGGSPISLDAIEQMSVSITPYDVRQSGFNGGAINAVTKSGTNFFKGSAYMHTTNNHLKGNHVGDAEWNRTSGHTTTYGVSLGGPIIKDKLFLFVNGEYEDIVAAGPTARAGQGGNDAYSNTNRRPTLQQLESLSKYMSDSYGFTTGPWQGFSLETPAYRFLARLDWNISDNHKFNVRFTKSNRKSSSGASASRSIGSNRKAAVYGVNSSSYDSSSYYGMSSLSSRYYSEYRFTSVAAELNSTFGKFHNTLRGTYSFQDQPRSQEYGNTQPIVEIVMNNGQGQFPYWALTGDVFSMGNLAQSKNTVITDELNATLGKHNLFAGLQYEHNFAANGYAQAAAGYYVYEATPEQVAAGDWGSVFGATPRAFGITYGNNAEHSMFTSKMSTNQWSLYFQDNMTLSQNFKLSLGVRFELPSYPELKDNYNKEYYDLNYGGQHFRTDQVPSNSISFSPRVGFNWDLTGDRKYVLRGGTGLFVGRMPFVWLVSSVGNSGMGQTSYFVSGNQVPANLKFTMKQNEMLQMIGASSSTSVPSGPTIMSDKLRMPKTLKASLAFDAKLPSDIDFSLEGIYNKDLNPVVVSNYNCYWDGSTKLDLGHGDVRHYASLYNKGYNAYVLENAGKKAYYWSLTAQLSKKFDFGLNLSAAYTHSQAKAYTEGIGDQVSSAYYNYTNSINLTNDHETGYATYVAPNRILLTASYKLQEGKHAASTFSLIYDGSEYGYLSGYAYSRYSYIFSSNIVNDSGAGNLIFVPKSREDLNGWNFVDSKFGDGKVYSADEQRNDFWTFIEQDAYLKTRKGQYAERGGAKMPWHHQLDFKFTQDFTLKFGQTRHAFQFGVDIMNLPNLLNSTWGIYKQIGSNSLLTYKAGSNGAPGTYTYNLVNNARNLTTSKRYESGASTYSVLFSLKYNFN